MLETICIILAVVGLILVVISILPLGLNLTYGLQGGIALIVIGVLLYIVLRLLSGGGAQVDSDVGLAFIGFLEK